MYCSFSCSVYQYIPSSILAGLVEGKEINSERQLSLIVVATSNKNLDVIMKSPKVESTLRSLEMAPIHHVE